ncbi:hypothetical protein NSK_004406 [Nannochloropsis salina CCMP1776]|uniref:HNH nuclease domain-containing protein n=1 Tax=Nannochloropsis salina CCMP1776 TaxID=1027361 RepID=A0A4D9CYE6_9STRA|nr:hypothetical protein NSK_004406 [Nannochloropsis salina CCMP1776]|eukprot:TFJ84421.1 hypothetical protein NSK_004406 [Nannochloropsis salina CCMP1776]
MARPENRAGLLRTVALVAFFSTLSCTKAFIIPSGTSPWLSVVHAPAFESEERRPAGGAPALSVRLAAAKKKTTGGGASPPSSKTSPALSVSTSKKKSRKDEGQAQRHAKHMKKPTDSATRADFGLGGPDFEMELLPPTDKNAGPKTATSRKGVSGSVGTVGGDEDHTTDHHLRLLRQTGKYPVLVLNTDAQPLSYLPLSIIRWQEAIKAIFLERVTVLAYYDSYIQSTAGPWQLPSVVCLKQYQKGCRERPPPLNRRNIYIRDRYSCAYCSQRLSAHDLTLDHVMPRSKGGKGSWDNLVTCCRQCNRRKGKRTVKELKEIGMVLLNPPRKPKMSELQRQARLYRTAAGVFPHESWETYLGGPPETEL